MRRQTLFILASLLIASCGRAPDKPQSPGAKPLAETQTDATASVDDILKNYVDAIGGKAAVERTQTQIAQVVNAGKVEFEIYKKAPNKWLYGNPDVWEGFDGATAWQQKAGADTIDLGADFGRTMTRVLAIHRAINLRKFFPQLELKGTEKVGAEDTYLVEGRPAEGHSHRFYFSKKTGLLIREIFTFDLNGTPNERDVYHEDYREVEGVKVPFIFRQEGQRPATLKFTEIKHNVPIDDAKFVKPSRQ